MSKERREHPRVDGEIEARLLINNNANAVVEVQDVSAGGIAFHYDGSVAIGDHIVAHLDGGARFEGDVVRIFNGGFAITLAMSTHKRKRLAETLERARARGRAIDRLNLERRLATRVSAMRQSVICETADRRVPVRIIDMSLTGVAIETEELLEMDSLVVIGKMRGTVVRKDGNRYGVQFLSAEDGFDAVGEGLAAAEPAAAPAAEQKTPARRQALNSG